MAVDIRITGAEKLAVLAGELRAAGEEGKGFRRQLLAQIRLAAAPAPEAVKQSAESTLPHAGGLNDWIASSKFAVRTRLTGRSVGVRIVGTKGSHDLEAIDAGNVRHPVWGRWVKGVPTQQVTPGFFTKPLEKSEPRMTFAVLSAIKAIGRELERG